MKYRCLGCFKISDIREICCEKSLHMGQVEPYAMEPITNEEFKQVTQEEIDFYAGK